MQLSKSAIDVFVDCACCFFNDRVLKICRPRGIFSSLPNGIDGILKERLDQFRGSLPPELKHPDLEGWTLFADAAKLEKMRNWRGSPLKYTDPKGNVLIASLDDLLENKKTGQVAIIDYKTKGSEPDQAYCEQYYQRQMDLYAFICAASGYKVATFGVLLYFWCVPDEQSLVRFESRPFFMAANADAGKKLFDEAVKCLEAKTPPPPSAGCEYCKFLAARK